MGLTTKPGILLALFLSTTLLLVLFGAPAVATKAPLTEATDYISASKQINRNERHYRTGAKCIDHTFTLRKAGWGFNFKFGKLKAGYFGKKEIRIPCATKTKYGIFGTTGSTDYIQLNGQAVAGEVMGHSFRHRIALPNSNTLLVSGDNFKTLYEVSNVAETISTATNIDRQVQYTLAPPGRKVVCEPYDQCKLDVIGHMESSIDGKTLVAHIPNFGMTSVSVEALDYQTFGRPSVYTHTGAPPYRLIAVSSGGSYAAVYYTDTEKLITYDLGDCKPNPLGSDKPDICTSNDMTAYLSDAGVDLTKLKGLSFAGEDNLYFYTKESGANKFDRTEVASADGKLLGEISYIALGDSFASGEGDLDAGWYEVGTDEPENKCHLSRRSYPYLLNLALDFDEFHSVACSGAVISDVTTKAQITDERPINSPESWFPGAIKQIKHLESTTPKAISVSIGGNDIGFADKLKECVIGPGTCKYAEGWTGRSGTAIEIANLKTALVDTYTRLIDTTERNTKIYAVGYPKFVNSAPSASCGLNVHLNPSEREFVDRGVSYMNEIIQSAAKEAGVYYLDIEESLTGRNLCSNAPDYLTAVNGLTKGNDTLGLIAAESYHPNPIGHELIYESIQNLTNNNLTTFNVCLSGELVCPEANETPLPDATYWGPQAILYVQNLNSPSSSTPAIARPERRTLTGLVEEQNSQIQIETSGLKPNSTVSIEIQSAPTPLGDFTVNNEGTLKAEVTIPANILAGLHTVHVFGKDMFSDPIDYYQHIYIRGPLGDEDGDGVPDENDPCGYIEVSGIDYDEDDVDDACDGFIGEKPTAKASNASEDVKTINVIGNTVRVALVNTALTSDTVNQGSYETSELSGFESEVLGAIETSQQGEGSLASDENVQKFANQPHYSDPDTVLFKVVILVITLASLMLAWSGYKRFIQQ